MKRAFFQICASAYTSGLVPASFRKWAGMHFSFSEQRTQQWIAKDPHRFDPPEWTGPGRVPYVLGIIKEFWHKHWHYIAACRQLGVSYKIIDLSHPDWIKEVEQSGCDAFLVRPSVQFSIWKQMYDERLKILVEDLGRIIYPTYEELWLYESKRRMHYWMTANGIPHPQTWVFYDMKEALDFVRDVDLPIVYKSDAGSGASGVKIIRNRQALKGHVKRCFGRGFTTYRRCPNDKEWGYVLLQKYIPDAKEWRMVRLGDSYFGHEKVRRGDFHSGSHIMRYANPPEGLLNFVKRVTDKGSFTSMDVDTLVTPDGRYLVNELQTLFGMDDPSEPQCVVEGKSGRMIWDDDTISWRFQEGSFCDNWCCNLRVQYVIDVLMRQESQRDLRQEHAVKG